MIFKDLNDYELLYLIKEGNEEAYNLMLKKYEPFIKKLAYRFYGIVNEDFIYDGYLVMLEAINKFDESFNKTFLKYFELLLARYYCKYLIETVKESKAYSSLVENIKIATRKVQDDRVMKAKREIFSIEDEMLKRIIIEHIYENYTISFLCKKYNYNVKKVYNKLYEIKNKLNKQN